MDDVDLSAEQEQQAVDAIVTLDWINGRKAAFQTLGQQLGKTDEAMSLIISDLSDRRIIKTLANEVNKNGPGMVKWDRGGMPTDLELITRLTALEGYMSLDDSRHVVSRWYQCSTAEADRLLHKLRDKHGLRLDGNPTRWLWKA